MVQFGRQPRLNLTAVNKTLLFSLSVGLVMFAACVTNPSRLPELDKRYYSLLENENDRAAFLKAKKGEREDFWEKKSLSSQWATIPPEEQQAVLNREVRVGFQEFSVHMAWGPSADQTFASAPGRRVRVETFVRCTSGPKTNLYVRENIDCDGTSSEVRVSIEDGVVTEVRYLD